MIEVFFDCSIRLRISPFMRFVLKTSREPSTKRKHLAVLDGFYAAVERQHGRDCLDWLIADADADVLEIA